MAKESIGKENPVIDALRKLKEEETDIQFRLKPLQEAIGALEKIVEKSLKKGKSPGIVKDDAEEGSPEEVQ